MTRTRTCLGLILLVAGAAACEVAPKDWSKKPESLDAAESAAGAFAERKRLEMKPAAARETAIEILVAATQDPNPLMRANAIESLQAAPEHLRPLMAGALADENYGVRFVTAMTVGQLEMVDQVQHVRPLLDDEQPSVQAAALFALKRCGKRVDLSPLGWMIRAQDPEVRANTALILGELGDPSAAPMIRESLAVNMSWADPTRARLVDLQCAEALVKLGQTAEIDVIRAALFTPAEQGEITALACIISGRLRDNRAVANLLEIAYRDGVRQEPGEVRLAACYAIGQIDARRAPIDVVRPYLDSEIIETRIQAVLTLGVIGNRDTLPQAIALLSDPDPLVNVAASAAILRIVD